MKSIRNQRGQGLIEYLIIVALMGVASIGIVRVLGSTVNNKFTQITKGLRGDQSKVRYERLDDSLHKKKDLDNFFEGVGKDESN